MAPAFDNLAPHHADIVAWREAGLTLHAIVAKLDEQKGVATSAPTLSRYFKETNPALDRPKPTAEQQQDIDAAVRFMEVMGEVRGLREETRAAIEHLAGQIKILNQRVRPPEPVKAEPSRQAWPLILVGFVAGIIVAGALFAMAAALDVAVFSGVS